MPHRPDDRDEPGYWRESARGNLSGEWARDPSDRDFGDNYARERWGGSGAGGDWVSPRATRGNTAAVGYGPARTRSTYGDNSLGGTAGTYGGADPLSRASYRGRGPKSYRRSDDRIAAEIHHRLNDDHDIDATGIEVRVENGEVTLEGTVDSRQAKRLAEDIVYDCAGVTDVFNRLRVERRDENLHIGKASE